jgi:uncharacterized protein (DUF433 family)
VTMNARPEYPGGSQHASILTSNPEVMGGRPVFRGTRIPVDVLFENLADGVSLDEILETYPGLRREDAIAAIMMAKERLKNCA